MSNYEVNQTKIGNRIKALRQEQELTQKELGAKLGVGASTIGMYETGKRSLDNEILTRLSDFFKVSSDYILCVTDIRNPLDSEANKKAMEIFNAIAELGIDPNTIELDTLKALLTPYNLLNKKK